MPENFKKLVPHRDVVGLDIERAFGYANGVAQAISFEEGLAFKHELGGELRVVGHIGKYLGIGDKLEEGTYAAVIINSPEKFKVSPSKPCGFGQKKGEADADDTFTISRESFYLHTDASGRITFRMGLPSLDNCFKLADSGRWVGTDIGRSVLPEVYDREGAASAENPSGRYSEPSALSEEPRSIPTPPEENTAMIVGVSVGVGVVLLGLIGAAVYRQQKSKK